MLSAHALLLSALSFSALTTAHFTLEWPPSRGFDDDKEPSFPCGGFDNVSNNRTAFPLRGAAPIQLKMGHTEANVQVLLAVGNDPGSAFDVVLRQTFRERGPDMFCVGGVEVPAGANLTAGMNATIQVVTNGDPEGGLYQCADVTLTDEMLSTDAYDAHCTNSSGVTAQAISNPRNANETSESSGDSSSSTTSSSASGTAASSASGASSTASAGAAAANVGSWAGAWALGAAAAVGGAVVAL
ncbi:gpi anchored protein [Diplodia corticola]|uniref:Gpi anchored protein n=1 Tax=Diplodia corticola TaxID=236234 RepID=A0A1J9S428_9PEZI|nr:gpi anchored protein [Diplodia corticola]OJD35295.1 gpi anchored protein [Diplodia corticola]